MPSPTLTPDLPTAAGQDTPPSAGPPGAAGPGSTGTAEAAGPDEAAAAGLRLVTVPGGWPPYDCETHGAACPVAGAAATAGPIAPAGPTAPARPTAPAGPTAPPGPDAAWPRQFAQVIVEILAGSRPSRQIAPWTTDRVRAQVDGLTRLLASDQRPRLQRVMTSRPAVSVVEMTMVVGFGRRSRALALRFERRPARPATPGRPARPARWLCTEIEAG